MVRDRETRAFWLAPMASTLPLIPFFCLPTSPWYLGKLMGEPSHPFLASPWGPWLGLAAVLFDGTLLAYFVALPLYLMVRGAGKLPVIWFGVAGILASQLVRALQHFRQPGLREFAVSGWSPLFGLACGLTAAGCFLLLRQRRFSGSVYGLPVGLVTLCGYVLVAAK